MASLGLSIMTLTVVLLGLALSAGLWRGPDLVALGLRLPDPMYAHRGRALFKRLGELGATRWRRQRVAPSSHLEVEVALPGAELRLLRHIDLGPQGAALTVSFSLTLRFEAEALWLAAGPSSRIRLSTARALKELGAVERAWHEVAPGVTLPDTMEVDRLGALSNAQRRAPTRLMVALLFRHADLSAIEALLTVRAPELLAGGARVALSDLTREQDAVELTYMIHLEERATYELEAPALDVALAHARALAEALHEGALERRCVEHLRRGPDVPRGVKTLSARLLAALQGEQRGEEFERLVWSAHLHFELSDLIAWLGPEILERLSDEDLRFFGRAQHSETLFEALCRRLGAVALINDVALCWEIRERALRRVLSEDEGLALYGPSMMSSLEAEDLVRCVGFLAREASPLLWRAPWFLKTLTRRFTSLTAAQWELLFDLALGDDDMFQHGFVSTEIARDAVLDATLPELQDRGAVIWRAPALCHHALSRRDLNQGARDHEAWLYFVSQLDYERIERALRKSWMWRARPLSLLRALCEQPRFDGLLSRHPECAQLMLVTFEASLKRDKDREDFDSLLVVAGELLARSWKLDVDEAWATRLMVLFTERIDARDEPPSAASVGALNAIIERTPTPEAAPALRYTLKRWLAQIGPDARSGALTHVEHCDDRAGGLTLKASGADNASSPR